MRIGELGTADRWRVAVRGAAVATAAMPGLLRGTVAVATAGEPGALVVPPDTALTREAAERATRELTTEVLAHSWRCWQWAMAFASIDGVHPDPELAFVAALLHDVALGAPDDPVYGCFAAMGGAQAVDVVGEHRDAAAAAVVGNAIAAHFHPASPAEPVAHCLHEAVNLDVVGYRLREVSAHRVATVERRYPRTGFDRAFARAMRTEVRLRPKSAAAVLWQSGARLPLTMNPLRRAERS